MAADINAALRNRDLVSLEKRTREEYAQLRQEIQSLKRELASLRTFITNVPPLSVTVDQYHTLKKNNDSYTSRSFYTHPHGYKMCIKIWPNGVLDGKNSHVSVACHIVCSEYDEELKWPFCGNVYLRLVNQRSDEQHCDHFIRYTRRTPRHLSGRVSRRPAAAGAEAATSYANYLVRFIAHSNLSNSSTGKHYLLNNTLQFIVTKVELR